MAAFCFLGDIDIEVNYRFSQTRDWDLSVDSGGMTSDNAVVKDLATLNILDEEEVPLVLLGDTDYLVRGEDPSIVLLWETVFWVQIHNLPNGFMTEGMARQIGDFISRFLEYDTSLVTKGFGQYMRIRVSIDVRLPLKRKKRIGAVQSSSSYVVFQYERLPLFCFLCDCLGHRESFCQVRLTLRNQQVEFGWDVSLRASPRRGGQAVSKWLREENGTDMWARMDIDGESRERVFGVDVINRGDHRESGGLGGRFSRQIRLVTERSILDISKNVIREGEGVGMEDFPIEFIDGKKR
ncbi:hypothetical protein GOBAR_AA33534 [Gossypium barbadense]|uniref:Zinc knuckle CX2CX4HX4C domain-containing protein n=1 Tax=Gossypium barbadense TaxID=3634 RepID=A0A2P5W7S8_GOSBA|nr:hypothetical protein GOBAR_AA33534 [Gossypium barbadense]